jgi:hypothetical protein
MSKNQKLNIELYTQHDIDVIGDNIDILMKDADKIIKTQYEPTIDEFKSVIKVVEQFIKSKNRIIYGGSALSKLILNKNKNAGIYGEYDMPDLEFYSPEPVKDLKDLCDLLFSKHFKIVQGSQAQHDATYKLFVNIQEIGDISYVPAFIYNKMPYVTIDGIRYIHPKFMYIDYLRMYTDPLMSFRRLEKAVPRGMTLLQYYPLEVGSGKMKYDTLPNTCSNIIKDISELINKSMSMMHVGTYAVKFYSIDKEPELLPYELISVEYNKDINNIYKELSQNYKITFKEYFPYFQFWDRHVEFIHENKVVLTIFKNYDRCTPYRKYDAGNIASFQQVLLHHLIKYYYNVNNRLDEDNVNNTVGSLIKSRNDYLKKHTKTVMDDTIFREFQINCLGKSMDGRRQYFLDMKKKKDQGRQIIYRYNPQTDFDHKLPDFSFDNTSGNIIKNERLYTIKLETPVNSEANSDNDSEIEVEKTTEGLPPTIKRSVFNKYESETKYPFYDTDYTTEF